MYGSIIFTVLLVGIHVGCLVGVKICVHGFHEVEFLDLFAVLSMQGVHMCLVLVGDR